MIRDYQEKDFSEVEKIIRDYWEVEIEMPNDVKQFIYHFLGKFYLYQNDLCLVSTDGKINAFLFAKQKEETNNALHYFHEHIISLSEDHQQIAKNYVEYLNYNQQQVLKYMGKNDIYLGLLASEKKGCGSLLIAELKQRAHQKDAESIFLWTDETCDFEYYERHNYQLLEVFDVNLFNQKIKTFIYKINIGEKYD